MPYKSDPNVKLLYTHSPVEIAVDENVSFAISAEGKVTISVKNVEIDPDSKIESDVLDEVTVSASLIYKIMSMLKNTRQVKKMSREEYVENRKAAKLIE